MSENEVKKCPKCGGKWKKDSYPEHHTGKLEKACGGKGYRIFGCQCKNCGYVEFYVKK